MSYNGSVDQTILYVLYNKELHAIKIGIADIANSRYKAHKAKGWDVVAYWHFFERDKARAIESLVLKTLRVKNNPYLSKDQMPQGGYTETFNADNISKKQIVRLINKTIKASGLFVEYKR